MNQELLNRLDIIAAKLGVTAQYLWGALLRQSRVEALEDTILTLISTVVIWHFFKLLGKGDEWLDDHHGTLLAAGILALICFVFGFFALYALPTEWLNPDYFALERLLSKIK